MNPTSSHFTTPPHLTTPYTFRGLGRGHPSKTSRRKRGGMWTNADNRRRPQMGGVGHRRDVHKFVYISSHWMPVIVTSQSHDNPTGTGMTKGYVMIIMYHLLSHTDWEDLLVHIVLYRTSTATRITTRIGVRPPPPLPSTDVRAAKYPAFRKFTRRYDPDVFDEWPLSASLSI